MGMKKVVIAAMQEYLLPELDDLKSGQSALRSELVHVNKRLDDVNLHLVDQSRRIDAVREELNQNIAAMIRRGGIVASAQPPSGAAYFYTYSACRAYNFSRARMHACMHAG